MAGHQLQENRFELKYILGTETKALAIRDFLRSYLSHDENAKEELDWSYPIHSLYLDSPSLTLCNATVNGLKNRFKLRIRYYDNDPGSPLYFEIKRRVKDAILKRRAAVRREALEALVYGAWPEPSHLMKPEDVRALDALRQFCDLRDQAQALPQVIVTYMREAWVTPENNSVRVTFDRCLCGEVWDGRLSVDGFRFGVRPPVNGVVLEMKFTDRFPVWMNSLVNIFNLQRCSMAKYVHCVHATRPAQVLTPIPRLEMGL